MFSTSALILATIVATILASAALATPYTADRIRVRRLAGGQDVDDGLFQNSFPFMAGIAYGNAKIVCGATIISPTQIITAASCTSVFKKGKTQSQPSLLVGSPDLFQDTISIVVKDIDMHPSYNRFQFLHDIAIVTFEPALTFSDRVKPALLPKTDILENSVAKSVGWGRILNAGDASRTLQMLDQKIISYSECQKLIPRYSEKITEFDFCAIPVVGADKAGTCNGDGGSPIVQNGTIIGILTWGPTPSSGEGCQSGYPDIFLNIFKYLDFINEKIIR